MNPLRIVSIHGSGTGTTYEFHKNVFDSILQKTDVEQIAIISTFGAPKTGKTFLLNFVRRFLTAPQPVAWLGENDTEDRLEGFPWSDNDPISNRGVWLSSEPITVIGSCGQVIEILLMDSKGSSEDKPTLEKEMEIFTAICTQLSSCTIYSAAKNISDDVLQKLASNVKSAQAKLGKPETDGPHFVFCVRDFEVSREFRFGTTGGHKYIQKTAFERLLRSSLPNSSCVLMPFPGEMTQWNKYNGNAACLEQNFIRIMDEFIPSTFDADCLSTLARIRSDYTDTFNKLSTAYGIQSAFANPISTPRSPSNFSKQKHPDPICPVSISEDSPNYKIYMDSLNQFKTSLFEVFQKSNVNQKGLNTAFERVQQEALEYFTDGDLRGNFRDIRAEEDKLAEDMVAYFKSCVSKWKNDQETIVEAIQSVYRQSLALYEEEMEELCKKPNQSRVMLLRFHRNCVQLAEGELENGTSDYPFEIVQPFFQRLTQEIQFKLKSFEEVIEKQESLRKEATNSFAETIAIQVYKEHMQNELRTRSFLQPEELEKIHQRVHKLSLGEFQKNVGFESIEDTASLSSQLNSLCQTYRNTNNQVKMRVEEELARVSSAASRQYDEQLGNQLKDNPKITFASFDKANELLLATVKAQFYTAKNNENACIFEQNWVTLMNKFRATYAMTADNVRQYILTRTAKYEKQATELVELLLQNFKNKITPAVFRKLNMQKLQKLCAENKKDVIETFNTNADEYDEDIKKKCIEQLESAIDTETTDITEKFKIQTMESRLRLKEAILDAKKYYDEEMGKKFYTKSKFYKPAELMEIHEKMFASIRTKFGAQLFAPQLQELRESLDPIFDVYKRKNDMNTPNTSTAIGIDLGTTYSCVAVYHAGEVKVLEDENGKRTIPSYFASIGGAEVIGHEAKNQAYIHQGNTVHDAKRILAKDFSDPTLQADMKNWSFEVMDEDGSARIKLKQGEQIFPPERISSKILKSLKSLATKYLRTEVKDVVITVPAYFNDGQRHATKDAGELAGLNVLSIINEPTAAALSYFWEYKQPGPLNVLVYDLGGGTFDVSVLTMQGGDVKVLATGGNGHLGGEDFDNNMIDYCLDEFLKKTSFDLKTLKTSPHAIIREQYHHKIIRLKNIVEDVKISLSYTESRNIKLEAIHGNQDLSVLMTRTIFNSLNQDLFDETLRIVEDTLRQSRLGKEEINEVILVGGSSKILKVKEMLREYFERDTLDHSVNPDEAVAKGAAILAAILSGNQEQKLRNISLEDVAPLSLGIGIKDDKFSVIIPRNTPVPVSKVEPFYKAPSQTSISLKVYEGEEPIASDNHYLGEFSISSLTATAEDEQIDVTMSISAENILSVTAKGNGISENFVVKRKGRMSEDEKRRYLQEENAQSEEG